MSRSVQYCRGDEEKIATMKCQVKTTLLYWLISLGINAQTLTFPDPNFENALVNFNVVDTTGNGLGDSVCDTNGDGFIQLSEAEAVIGLIVSYQNIESLEGIEYFSNLETLKSRGNFLSSLDLSQNAQLTWLHIETNPLTEIDLSQNFLMERLWIYQIQLSALDVSHMPSLQSLRVYTNQLQSLNIQNGNNEQLTDFQAYNNPNLYCIQVDDVGFAESNPNWVKDESAQYNENCLLGVNSFELAEKVILFPNPVTDQCTIESEIPVVSVTLYDSSAKKLLQFFHPKTDLNLESIAAGFYVVKVQTSEGNVWKRLVKN